MLGLSLTYIPGVAMSKKPHQFWIVYAFYTGYLRAEKEFSFIKYLHNDRVFIWGSDVGEAHCFVSKKKAEQIALQKGGMVDLHPRSRYE